MQLRLPIRSAVLVPSLLVLSALSLTFAPATAGEGDAVSWPGGTTISTPAPADGIEFDSARATTQFRLVDVAEATIPATVIDLQLDEFRPLRLEVVDLEGNLVRTLADGLWAEGRHRMAWHHENEDGEILEDGVYLVRLSAEPTVTEGLALAR